MPRRNVVVYIILTLVLCAVPIAEYCSHGPSYSGYHEDELRESIHHIVSPFEYPRLGDALIHGRLWLDLEVPEALSGAENPYDVEFRYAMGEAGTPAYWDTAFYDGKYYCYFGVVPAILLFVPYQLVTGHWLGTPEAVLVLGLLLILAFSLFVWRIGTLLFPSTATTGSLCLCLAVLFSGSNVAYLCFVLKMYSIPILSSLVLTTLGLMLWLESSHDRRGPGGQITWWKAVLGSCCMALNLGCRPQFVLSALLALPIFFDDIFVRRRAFTRDTVAGTIAVILPFIVIWIPLFAYNQARFGSPLDFGSSYNLTGFDMTSYDQPLSMTLDALYNYFIAPVQITPEFPYVQRVYPTWSVDEFIPVEPMFGGYLWLVPVSLFALAFPAIRRQLATRKLSGFVPLLLVLGVICIIVDTRIAGLTQRYFSEFGLFLMMANVFVLLCLQERLSLAGKKAWRAISSVACALIIVSACIGGLSLLSPNRFDSLEFTNPPLYQEIAGFFGS